MFAVDCRLVVSDDDGLFETQTTDVVVAGQDLVVEVCSALLVVFEDG